LEIFFGLVAASVPALPRFVRYTVENVIITTRMTTIGGAVALPSSRNQDKAVLFSTRKHSGSLLKQMAFRILESTTSFIHLSTIVIGLKMNDQAFLDNELLT